MFAHLLEQNVCSGINVSNSLPQYLQVLLILLCLLFLLLLLLFDFWGLKSERLNAFAHLFEQYTCSGFNVSNASPHCLQYFKFNGFVFYTFFSLNILTFCIVSSSKMSLISHSSASHNLHNVSNLALSIAVFLCS